MVVVLGLATTAEPVVGMMLTAGFQLKVTLLMLQLAVREEFKPAQMVEELAPILTFSEAVGSIPTVMTVLPIQPKESRPEMVYVVVVVGLATAMVAGLGPGDKKAVPPCAVHVYVMLLEAPATLKVVGKPAHTEGDEAEGVNVNAGFMLTVVVWKGFIGKLVGLVQPALSAVNTYTVNVLGFTTTVLLGVTVGEVIVVPLTTAYV